MMSKVVLNQARKRKITASPSSLLRYDIIIIKKKWTQDFEIFGDISLADQFEILHGACEQAQRATVRCLLKSCRRQALSAYSATAHLQQVA